MTDDQHAEGAPGGGRWDPLPQGDYDDGATAFVKLPEGGIDALLAGDSPLAAPGHGYVPPRITVTPTAPEATDPAATGGWGQPAAPAEGTQWPDPSALPQDGDDSGDAGTDDRFTYPPGITQQWDFQDSQGHGQGHRDTVAGGPAPGHDVTGQWSIPVAGGDLPDESGEFTTSSLVQQWGGTPPATLPGGAPAPWATEAIGEPWARPQEDPAGSAHGSEPAAHPYRAGPAEGDPRPGTPAPPAAHPHAEARPEHGQPAGAPHASPYAGPAEPPEPGTPHEGTGHAPAAHPAEQRQNQPPAAGAEAPAAQTGAPAAQARTPDGEQDPGTSAASPAATPSTPGTDGTAEAVERAVQGAERPEDPAAAEGAGTASQAAGEPVAAPGSAAPDTDAADGHHREAAPADDPPPAPPRDEHPLASYVLRVNGADRPVTDAWIGESLLYVLRERLGLAGAKDGCSQGECGACNVQVDGRLVASCLVPAASAAGSEVRTVEGLAVDGQPSDVQRALARCGAVQCGFCVPGMAMTVHDLLEGNPAPTELETRQALCGNLCRCSGYRGVLRAVEEVVAEREAHAAAEHAAAADGADADADEPRIPHQAGPGAGGIHPSAFDSPEPHTPHDPYGQDGGQV